MHKVEIDNVYKNYRYLVIFRAQGYRCGYVGISENHQYYDEDYSTIDNISVHGRLTYSDWSPIENNDNLWWLGFDCGHVYDARDYETAYRYFPGEEKEIDNLKNLNIVFDNAEIRTKEYAEEECKKVIDQLIEMESVK